MLVLGGVLSCAAHDKVFSWCEALVVLTVRSLKTNAEFLAALQYVELFVLLFVIPVCYDSYGACYGAIIALDSPFLSCGRMSCWPTTPYPCYDCPALGILNITLFSLQLQRADRESRRRHLYGVCRNQQEIAQESTAPPTGAKHGEKHKPLLAGFSATPKTGVE